MSSPNHYNIAGSGKSDMKLTKDQRFNKPKAKSTSGDAVTPAADFSSVGKPARPGGSQAKPPAPAKAPKVARPGGPQGVGKGK